MDITFVADLFKRVIERKLVMGIANATLACDGEIIYTANDLRVGLFQADAKF